MIPGLALCLPAVSRGPRVPASLRGVPLPPPGPSPSRPPPWPGPSPPGPPPLPGGPAPGPPPLRGGHRRRDRRPCRAGHHRRPGGGHHRPGGGHHRPGGGPPPGGRPTARGAAITARGATAGAGWIRAAVGGERRGGVPAAGAAVPGRVAVRADDGHAPAGRRMRPGGGDEVPGHVRVDRPERRYLTGGLREPEECRQRDGHVDPRGQAARRPARRPRGDTGAARCGIARGWAAR